MTVFHCAKCGEALTGELVALPEVPTVDALDRDRDRDRDRDKKTHRARSTVPPASATRSATRSTRPSART